MRIDGDAVLRPVVLGLVLLSPVLTGVGIVHVMLSFWLVPAFLMWVATIAVLWIYAMIEARSKHGWWEVVLAILAMPFFAVSYFALPPLGWSERPFLWPFAFLPWLAILSLLSAHWYGRKNRTALALSLVVTIFLSAIWYQETLHWILRRYFMWN